MRKFAASAIITLATIGGIAATAGAAVAAPAVEINHGWCNQQVDPQMRFSLAPGVYGNGPFVIVNGDFVSTTGSGFEGFMGCYR